MRGLIIFLLINPYLASLIGEGNNYSSPVSIGLGYLTGLSSMLYGAYTLRDKFK